MAMRCLVLALALATYSEASLLRGHAESLEVEVSAEWEALSEAESEDRRFLLAQVDQTESQLVQLQHFLEGAGGHSTVMAGLQISAAPVDKKASVAMKGAVATAPAAKTPETKTVVAKKDVVEKKEDESPAAIAASLGVKLPNIGAGIKGAMKAAALAPMLGMLKGLYQDSKDRISQQNTREEKSKKWFTEKEADHKAKLAEIEGKFQNHTLSEEFRTNETRDETRYFTYWERCRQRQHRQFHTNLKIQHAMMSKVKKMIDMYEKALSPKAADQTAAKHALGAMTGMPEIVFLQDVKRTVGSFLQESLAEVRKERIELQENLAGAEN